MIKSFKIRLFPTKEQEELMWKHVNSCRFIWNYMLEKQISRENNNEKPLSAYDMINLISPMKQQKEFKWLKDVSNSSLCKTCLDLGSAFSRFLKSKIDFRNLNRKRTKDTPVLPETNVFILLMIVGYSLKKSVKLNINLI